jgi:beta-lactamase class A
VPPARLRLTATLVVGALVGVGAAAGGTALLRDSADEPTTTAVPETSADVATEAPTPDDGTAEAAEAAAAVRRGLLRLERSTDGARLGLVAVDTATGAQVSYRGAERFALASTVKLPVAAVALDRSGDQALDRRVAFTAADLVPYSPVTEQAVTDGLTGLTVRELVEAALVDSDNTAANLLLEEAGGPAAVERRLRTWGDTTTSVDRTEPTLNDWRPGERRDTSTPRALAETARALLVDDVLDPADGRVILDAMTASTTGLDLVRAGVPAGWEVADKSGTASYGTRNDVALVRPPGRAPWVVVVMTRQARPDAEPDDDLVARATEVVVEHWD